MDIKFESIFSTNRKKRDQWDLYVQNYIKLKKNNNFTENYITGK